MVSLLPIEGGLPSKSCRFNEQSMPVQGSGDGIGGSCASVLRFTRHLGSMPVFMTLFLLLNNRPDEFQSSH